MESIKYILTTIATLGFIVMGTLVIFALFNKNNQGKIHWSYEQASKTINNEYFKSRVVADDGARVFIIENELTGEKFLCIAGSSNISVTPIAEGGQPNAE